jgi:CDP-glucose 4,6-dehydratase
MVDSLFHSFYEGKPVLVTGHTGFKGGWLVTWLKMLGARVIGFSLPPENGKRNLFGDANVGEGMVSIFGDIRDLSSLKTVFETHKPEIVFHLAAQSQVRRSYLQPVNTYTTNVTGTVNVLEAMRHTPSVRAAVIVTSDKCYENREWVYAYREIDPMGGYDPYSSSKGCAELVTAAYRNSFFREKNRVAVASVRAGNVIGGGDWADDRLVPDVVRALLVGLSVVIRNPGAVRPWQHVLEPLRGYLLLGKLLRMQGNTFAEAWNFGPCEEDCVSVREVVEKIIRLWGAGELKVQADPHRLHEAGNLWLYCGKARERLGWRPLLTIDEAIEMTVSTYRAYMGTHASAARVIEDQIQGYMERIA